MCPALDTTTQQTLSENGYQPVTVHSREEAEAQIPASAAAFFVDPLTAPITRTSLQALGQAAVAARIPLLVTAGIAQAPRPQTHGADPAALIQSLIHSLIAREPVPDQPRVLLIESRQDVAQALTACLERRGMPVSRARSEDEAVPVADRMVPRLVLMDLMLIRSRRYGITDWLRDTGRLGMTPLVAYTARIDPADRARLASGETALYLTERSTHAQTQPRIMNLIRSITDRGPVSEHPKTETTLTTRVRIKIPGSRPIPPVVVRRPVADPDPDPDRAADGLPSPTDPEQAAKVSDWFAPKRLLPE